jgi:hypothetical protein
LILPPAGLLYSSILYFDVSIDVVFKDCLFFKLFIIFLWVQKIPVCSSLSLKISDSLAKATLIYASLDFLPFSVSLVSYELATSKSVPTSQKLTIAPLFEETFLWF